MKKSLILRVLLLITVAATVITASGRLRADSGTCDGVNVVLPFTDVAGNFFFCQIAAAYFSGLTNGTTPTTYSPNANVTRDQMAAFTTRTLDQSLNRGKARAALNQWWTTEPKYDLNLAVTTVGKLPQFVQSDGRDLWVANFLSGTVSRVRASDGASAGTWSGANSAIAPLCAMGKVFVTGQPSNLYMIDPSQPPATVITLTSSLGIDPEAIAFDGSRIWTANGGNNPGGGSISIVTPAAGLPWSVLKVSSGFSNPAGILYDGNNIWVTDRGDNTIKKLNSDGSVALIVPVGNFPLNPIFDGSNIWVPNHDSNTVTVIRSATGAVLSTLSGNGLFKPNTTAFDGERILVTNAAAYTVSLWTATSLSPIGFVSTGPNTYPYGACSDGLNFWISMPGGDPNMEGKLARF